MTQQQQYESQQQRQAASILGNARMYLEIFIAMTAALYMIMHALNVMGVFGHLLRFIMTAVAITYLTVFFAKRYGGKLNNDNESYY